MSPSQSQAGRAFEYAVVCALKSVVGESNIALQQNSCSKLARKDFSSFPDGSRQSSLASTIAAVKQILLFEPYLQAAVAETAKLIVEMQPDRSGGFGDVRDVVIRDPKTDWQIGISAKHQHEALKHSRLSKTIDFGQQWFGHNCSPPYFDQIRPIFDHLTQLREREALWSAVPNKDSAVYVPLLKAFREELIRLDRAHPAVVAPRMVQYLIGTFDFYKVIKLSNQTKVQVYNFNGSLNRSFGRTQPTIKLDRLKLPTRIIELDFKRDASAGISTTTLDLVCDGGWQLSLRLHNASSRVEPSLKFDINLVGRPNNLQTFSIAG
jgi:hypothetical protein